jgi:hypothetical protein
VLLISCETRLSYIISPIRFEVSQYSSTEPRDSSGEALATISLSSSAILGHETRLTRFEYDPSIKISIVGYLFLTNKRKDKQNGLTACYIDTIRYTIDGSCTTEFVCKTLSRTMSSHVDHFYSSGSQNPGIVYVNHFHRFRIYSGAFE